ncbi:probable M18 family aminopeptidase 2 [Ylistrum balloti]|uniref:probable M18 family aminopeptidase 2 n=1 Tax=Ylistrum balloti TaxID=509963 RepID=UPI0029059D40|nr:probable M18 family aminopeptidase 2 [Ylistrum balloti]
MTEIESWMQFIEHSPTSYHTVDQVIKRLKKGGFVCLDENTNKKPNQAGYFISKNGSIIAFLLPRIKIQNTPSFRIWGAHTDSPSLHVKPICEINKKGYQMISTEVYGGAILSSWLDRPLGMAGKVYVQKNNKKNQKGIEEKLLFINDPLMVIPHAAIHLNREVNKQFSINKATHLNALFSNRNESLNSILSQHIGCKAKDILSHDLFLVDIEPPKIFGREKQFINSPRLDNLAMVHAGLEGFLKVAEQQNKLDAKKTKSQDSIIPAVVFFNHEEVGSQTYQGALSNFLTQALIEILQLTQSARNKNQTSSEKYFYDCLAKSFMISADMAHGFHPNFESLYDENHRPILNQGLVIKYNANQRYATDGSSSAIIKQIMLNHQLPYQEYVQQAEIPCGSTIGPLVSSQLGIPTVDIGSAMLAMHSIRETAGIQDHLYAIQLAEKFLSHESIEIQ